MTKLEQVIPKLQQELEKWRGESLKETPTRTVFIEPLLEALGWDIRDLDEPGGEPQAERLGGSVPALMGTADEVAFGNSFYWWTHLI